MNKISEIVPLGKPALIVPPEQKTFDRLKKKIASLQAKLQQLREDLEDGLSFYYGHLQPREKSFAKILIEFVKTLHVLYLKKGNLSKNEKKSLKNWILSEIRQISSLVDFEEMDAEIRQIFTELKGVKYEEMASNELGSMKGEMQEMFAKMGVPLNLDSIDVTDGQSQMMDKFMDALEEAYGKGEMLPRPKTKTKKQLQKEQQRVEQEELLKKGIGGIYKRLAKAFHPDLEQDPFEKSRKEGLMKRLTTAYESEDFYTLLSLEMEWMTESNDSAKQHASAQLKIYNSLLKEQEASLQQHFDMLLSHPKYILVERFFTGEIPGKVALQQAVSELAFRGEFLQTAQKDLQGPQSSNLLRSLLAERSLYCED